MRTAGLFPRSAVGGGYTLEDDGAALLVGLPFEEDTRPPMACAKDVSSKAGKQVERLATLLGDIQEDATEEKKSRKK